MSKPERFGPLGLGCGAISCCVAGPLRAPVRAHVRWSGWSFSSLQTTRQKASLEAPSPVNGKRTFLLLLKEVHLRSARFGPLPGYPRYLHGAQDRMSELDTNKPFGNGVRREGLAAFSNGKQQPGRLTSGFFGLSVKDSEGQTELGIAPRPPAFRVGSGASSPEVGTGQATRRALGAQPPNGA
jgi:hypothetical protein